jgi:PIN domain nuclease of toxin-antitoxin system
LVLLDTHVWLWWLLGENRLPERYRVALDALAEKGKLALSIVSVWEAEMLEDKQRIILLPDFETWVKKATHPSFIKVLPFDAALILAQRKLPLEFHRDPGDRLIAATSLLHSLPLVTFDGRIQESLAVPLWKP